MEGSGPALAPRGSRDIPAKPCVSSKPAIWNSQTNPKSKRKGLTWHGTLSPVCFTAKVWDHRKSSEEGGAEGVLNVVVGFLGAADWGLIDAGLAERPGAKQITFLSLGLRFLSALLVFHLSQQKRASRKERSQLYLHRSLHRRSHLGRQHWNQRRREAGLADEAKRMSLNNPRARHILTHYYCSRRSLDTL